MVVGRSWSPRASLEKVEGDVEEALLLGRERGMRLYFLVSLGVVSSLISLRKDCSSCSASSSRERGLEGVDVGSGID